MRGVSHADTAIIIKRYIHQVPWYCTAGYLRRKAALCILLFYAPTVLLGEGLNSSMILVRLLQTACQ